jgi:hypothetical protein
MRKVLLVCLLLALPRPAFATTYYLGTTLNISVEDEFDGPFPNWLNCQTAYGATGNGSRDDTTALQNCITAAKSGGVAWIPAGTYKITSTLDLTACAAAFTGFDVIGADPATTSIVWAGAAGGTMVNAAHMNNSTISRLTFNGSRSAGTIIAQQSPGGQIGVENRYMDDVFENAATGVIIGSAIAAEDSEIEFLRDTFSALTTVGITTNGPNSVDLWVWYCKFLNNAVGIQSGTGGGQFSVYESYFTGSTVIDINQSYLNQFEGFRYNVSSNSNRFCCQTGIANSTPSPTTLQGNIIINDTNPLRLNSRGPWLLLDNQFLGGTTQILVNSTNNGGQTDGETVNSIGNLFTAKTPYSFTAGNARVVELSDQTGVGGASINQTIAATQPCPNNTGFCTPPNNIALRNVTEETSSKTAAQINSDIATACINYPTSKPIVHLQTGTYSYSTTLSVPSNCNVQILGDGPQGFATLNWNASGGGPMIKVASPGKATLSGFNMHGNGYGIEGIYVESEDSVASRVNINGLNTGYVNSVSGITLDSVAHTQANVVDTQIESPHTTTWHNVNVIGTGTACGTGTNCARMVLTADLMNGGGAPPGPGGLYNVHNGGQLSVRDTWSENPTAFQVIYENVDSGNFTIESSMGGVSSGTYNSAKWPMLYFHNFTGNVSILNYTVEEIGQLGISNMGVNSNVLADGTYLCSSNTSCNTWWAEGETLNSTNANNVSVQAFTGEGGEAPIADIGTPSNSFLLTMYAQDRDMANRDWLDTALPARVTEVYISRIGLDGLTNGIHIKAGP